MANVDMMSIEEFAARLQANGFEPSRASLEEMYAALPHLNALRARLRRNYAPSDEPAHTFSVKGMTP